MKRTGFTLMDLLVIILILLVVAAFFPVGTLRFRESARYMQCGNNLKNQALAALNHETTVKTLPSGGWNVNYVGDPDCGFGPKQPGTWTFSMLPFLEQNALFQVGATGKADACERKKNSEVLETPISCFMCPSRHEFKALPLGVTDYLNSNFTGSQGAKSDYAANYGTTVMKIGNSISYETPDDEIASPEEPTGVIFDASAVTIGDITDGTANTYLIGEKFVYTDQYEQSGPGDKASVYAGIADDDSNSNFRSAGVLETKEWFLPTQDAAQAEADQGSWRGFGSAHADSFGMAMCDGSVQRISYKIDGETSARLANRKDMQSTHLPE